MTVPEAIDVVLAYPGGERLGGAQAGLKYSRDFAAVVSYVPAPRPFTPSWGETPEAANSLHPSKGPPNRWKRLARHPPTSRTTSACSAGTGGSCSLPPGSGSGWAPRSPTQMPKVYESSTSVLVQAVGAGHQPVRRPHQGLDQPGHRGSARRLRRGRGQGRGAAALAGLPGGAGARRLGRGPGEHHGAGRAVRGRHSRRPPRPARTRSPRRTCATVRRPPAPGWTSGSRR